MGLERRPDERRPASPRAAGLVPRGHVVDVPLVTADGHPDDARVERREASEGVAVEVDDPRAAAGAPVDEPDPDAVAARADLDLAPAPVADPEFGSRRRRTCRRSTSGGRSSHRPCSTSWRSHRRVVHRAWGARPALAPPPLHLDLDGVRELRVGAGHRRRGSRSGSRGSAWRRSDEDPRLGVRGTPPIGAGSTIGWNSGPGWASGPQGSVERSRWSRSTGWKIAEKDRPAARRRSGGDAADGCSVAAPRGVGT